MKTLIQTLLLGVLLSATPLMAQQKMKKVTHIQKVDVYIVAKPQDIPINLEYSARITPVKDITITARVSGILQKKYFTEGASVQQGKILYKVEPGIYAADVNNAKATLNFATSQFEKTKKNWERAKGLYTDKATSEQDKDDAYFAFTSAKANKDAAEAQLEKSMVILGYTNVNATISGVAGIKIVDVGDYVKEGTPLLTITQTNPIYAEFSIPDINALKQKYMLVKGSWANLQAANLKAVLMVNGKEYDKKGKVNFVDVKVNQNTSTLKMRAVFENESAKLIAGQFTKIKVFGIISKNVLVVPQKAVLQNPLGTIVFIVNQGKVSVKPVKILNTIGQNFIVSGIKAGEKVVINNFFRIKPGAPVSIDKIINKQE